MKHSRLGSMAVIGNGMIGHGIAEVFAKAGWEVNLIGRSQASLERALQRIEASVNEFVQAGLLDAPSAQASIAKIRISTEIQAAAAAEFVIEALPEDIELKLGIFSKLDRICRSDAVLATSSGHPASAVDKCVEHRERVIAAHFWSPPQLIPLVEICGSDATTKTVIERTCVIVGCIGKMPVVVDREVPGLIGNRIQFAALREAWALWAAGVASAEAIDSVVRHSIGRRLAVTGPIESADLGGLDTMYHFARLLEPSLDTSSDPPESIAALVRSGHCGASSGKGIYDWTERDGSALLSARRRELMRWLHVDRQGS
ncbi:3-hydroxyacyl-CoA dehydrogenase family protein (plasmid) [Rhizobium sp. CB3171]|uniref:3-hydroxyacyl-CoA dehydrogenase family protein n=1 Tax=Rhizobium sp. CB3171 TaxID=3039157 RepID=UPI0024B26D97|nr:3-hydroxyacyl-CoA dehydrogenase family protein [Rhizobium sp. CB3171]WFU06699.1 3-hydroxyacyl-CoA dehydrogenase family protein [Rhizobium sp. CB3171]